jgi:beta-phosphoglucomutase
MIAAVVFDFDGVLANSEPLHLRAYQEVFSSLGVELSREQYYAEYLGFDDHDVFQTLAAARGWALDEAGILALIQEKSRVFDGLIGSTEVLYQEAEDCIRRLSAEFPLGIASGALRHEIEAVLQRAGLDRHFRFIVASGDTAASKPSPDPYIRAAHLHGLPPSSCVAIEDSRWGIESARTAGLKCVGITTTYPAPELWNADRVIDSLHQFSPDLIRSL